MTSPINLTKADFLLEKKKHLEILSQKNFQVQIPSDYFTLEIHKELIEKGRWFEALETEKIKPITTRQFYFVQALKKKDYSGSVALPWFVYKRALDQWGSLYQILKEADTEELQILSDILKIDERTPKRIIRKLETSSQNLIEVLDDRSYRDILNKVKKKLKIDGDLLTDKEIERRIAVKILENTLSKMSPEEKLKFEEEVIKISGTKGKNLKTGAVFATLTAANLSGFGVYLLATSALSTISSIIGIGFSFAAYTTLTSAISVITGPIGWLGAGGFSLWKYTDVNYKKLIPAIIYIHWLREKYQPQLIS